MMSIEKIIQGELNVVQLILMALNTSGSRIMQCFFDMTLDVKMTRELLHMVECVDFARG